METKIPLKMHVVRLVNDENQTVNTTHLHVVCRCAQRDTNTHVIATDKRWYINTLNDDYNANCETSF